MTTKAEIVSDVSALLGFKAPPMSTGSTEPRDFFAAINRVLGLGLDPDGGKQGLARGIVEAAGMPWEPDYESRGATVTLKGLEAVASAVDFFVAE